MKAEEHMPKHRRQGHSGGLGALTPRHKVLLSGVLLKWQEGLEGFRGLRVLAPVSKICKLCKGPQVRRFHSLAVQVLGFKVYPQGLVAAQV